MKTKELMVCDWINANPEDIDKVHCVKVLAVSPNKIYTRNDYFYYDSELRGISLTPDILEINGWYETQYWYEYQNENITIKACLPDIQGLINGIEIQHFECNFVHEFQHLLRLCGMSELANNFKIL